MGSMLSRLASAVRASPGSEPVLGVEGFGIGWRLAHARVWFALDAWRDRRLPVQGWQRPLGTLVAGGA